MLTTSAARSRASVAVVAILGVAVAVAASLYVWRNAAEAPAANAIVRAVMALTALALGLYLWRRQPHNRYGPVLAAAVFFLSPMALAVSAEEWPFTIGRTVGAMAIVYAIFLALIFPDGRAEERGARVVLGAAVAASAVLWSAALAFAQTLPAGGPFVPCFQDCPHNAAQVVEISPDPSQALGLAYGAVCAVLGLGSAAVLLERLRKASPMGRRSLGPVLVVISLVCIGLGAYIFIRELDPGSALLDPLGWMVLGAFMVFPLMIWIGLIRGRTLAASALENLVERLGSDHSPASVQEAMRAALRDSSLELLIWSSSTRSYVDAVGEDVDSPGDDAGRAVTMIDRNGRPVAAIVHDPALDSQPETIRAVASAGLLAMEKARLEADQYTVLSRERRRIARDLHDGMAQDLAFISVHGQDLARRDPRVASIAAAAQRALVDSRAAILSLSGSDESLASAVARTATALADRSGIALELELDEGIDAEPETRAELLRILSEAISNAIRHGKASRIRVALSAQPGLRLAISDDGCGFDVEARPEGDETGFGITCMRERAQGLGGELHMQSRPGAGTEVDVVIP